MLVRAEYAWDPQDPVELSLEQGEVLAVVSQSTGSEGWWEGQNAAGSRGLFPFNHVELLPPPDVQVFMEGKHLATSAPQPSTVERVRKDHIPKTTDRPIKVIKGFAVATLQAFDDMIDKGFAVENLTGNTAGPYPKPGDRVELQFKAHIWDCRLFRSLSFWHRMTKAKARLSLSSMTSLQFVRAFTWQYKSYLWALLGASSLPLKWAMVLQEALQLFPLWHTSYTK